MNIFFRIKIGLLGLMSFSSAVFSQSQHTLNAKQIIEKNIQATGGLNQWRLLNTIMLQGKVVLGVNEEYPVKIYQARPNLTKTMITIGKREQVIEGYDGKKGYAMNYATNKLQEYPSYKPESFDTDFINYEQKGFTAEYLGEEKLGNQDVYKVELTKNVNKTIYYFDKQTFYLVKEVKKDDVLKYSEHKRVGHLVMPFRIEAHSPKKDSDYVIILQKIELNKAFPEETFKFK